jgi:DsbC/DsbD-like thiol-disulfide interchange protein/cytochrome c biogenesis protein CcdA
MRGIITSHHSTESVLMPPYRPPIAHLWRGLIWLIALFFATPILAAPTHIHAEMIVESGGKAGKTVTLAIVMRPEAGWHGYWLNPGDAGQGMTLKWAENQAKNAGKLQYPVPETLPVSGLMNHVYAHDYAILIPYTLPKPAQSGAIPLEVEAHWLACTDQICVPEQAVLSAHIPISTTPSRDPRFDLWRAKLPAPLGAAATFTSDSHQIRLKIALPADVLLENPHIFAENNRIIAYAAPQMFSRLGDNLLVTLNRAKFQPLTPDTFPAVLRLNAAGDGLSFTAKPGPVPIGGTPLAVTSANLPSLPALLFAALIGGLLLNVMPCVFPILSLKALSLAKSGSDEAIARADGLAYSAGVILATTALGGGLLILRAFGAQLGWAFQLQEPSVVIILLLLAVAITANLLGLYEFSIPSFARKNSGQNQNAFLTGMLAAFVATPCTGPFMASAMGAALILPPLSALLLFAALGLGIALPFLAIALIPPLRRMLPKPGAWMVWFRRILAVPMALTAVALVWLASRLGGDHFALWGAIYAALLIFILFKIGRQQQLGHSLTKIHYAGLAVLLTFALVVIPKTIQTPTAETASILASQPYTEANLAKARASGHPVFAYFTADWCLTCKVNERVAIEREDTSKAFAKAGFIVIKGDWTRRDPAITRYLTAHNAAGVPLYIYYPAGAEGKQLPQVLTPQILSDAAR